MTTPQGPIDPPDRDSMALVGRYQTVYDHDRLSNYRYKYARYKIDGKTNKIIKVDTTISR